MPARPDSGRDGPPRLILRFAVSSAVALALAAGAILLVVRHFNTVQAERAATSQARVVAGAALRGSLVASDFAGPVLEPRRSALDELFERRVLDNGVVLVNLYAADGTVTYSTDHRLIGTSSPRPEHLREARAGTIRGDVTTLAVGEPDARRKVLRTYAPVPVAGGAGVVAIFQDYAPIAAAANSTFLPIAGIFEAALILLFLALVPLLRSVTIRIRRQVEEIEHRSLHDDLTGLPNRMLFGDRVQQAIFASRRGGGSPAVMLLDVGRLKDINNTLGHETGDDLLQALAARLRAELRANETLARLAGDEFGLLLPATSAEEAMHVAARVHELLESPFTLAGLPLEVGASIGIAACPEHGEEAETLLRHADVAMYMAKEAHAKTAFYDAEQDTNDAARLALAGELRRALDRDELVVFFQPKADLRDGRVVGVEALVRWQHPERGLIPPNDFVPIAERTGLIKPLSRVVLAAAVRQCEAWNVAGYDLHVSVNLTIPDLLDLELPDRLGTLLAQSGVRPEQLELEITETTILADPFRVRQVLNGLNEIGLGLAIDDFGTGYSSLAYLKRLPVQTIKIDRSFVMGMCDDASDATIVRSTIDLGRNLGLTIVAEGVESQKEWDALKSQGCTLAQGYFISRPLPAGELAALLDERGARAAGSAAALARP